MQSNQRVLTWPDWDVTELLLEQWGNVGPSKRQGVGLDTRPACGWGGDGRSLIHQIFWVMLGVLNWLLSGVSLLFNIVHQVLKTTSKLKIPYSRLIIGYTLLDSSEMLVAISITKEFLLLMWWLGLNEFYNGRFLYLGHTVGISLAISIRYSVVIIVKLPGRLCISAHANTCFELWIFPTKLLIYGKIIFVR